MRSTRGRPSLLAAVSPTRPPREPLQILRGNIKASIHGARPAIRVNCPCRPDESRSRSWPASANSHLYFPRPRPRLHLLQIFLPLLQQLSHLVPRSCLLLASVKPLSTPLKVAEPPVPFFCLLLCPNSSISPTATTATTTRAAPFSLALPSTRSERVSLPLCKVVAAPSISAPSRKKRRTKMRQGMRRPTHRLPLGGPRLGPRPRAICLPGAKDLAPSFSRKVKREGWALPPRAAAPRRVARRCGPPLPSWPRRMSVGGQKRRGRTRTMVRTAVSRGVSNRVL
jgi:hypothetical protein